MGAREPQEGSVWLLTGCRIIHCLLCWGPPRPSPSVGPWWAAGCWAGLGVKAPGTWHPLPADLGSPDTPHSLPASCLLLSNAPPVEGGRAGRTAQMICVGRGGSLGGGRGRHEHLGGPLGHWPRAGCGASQWDSSGAAPKSDTPSSCRALSTSGPQVTYCRAAATEVLCDGGQTHAGNAARLKAQ